MQAQYNQSGEDTHFVNVIICAVTNYSTTSAPEDADIKTMQVQLITELSICSIRTNANTRRFTKMQDGHQPEFTWYGAHSASSQSLDLLRMLVSHSNQRVPRLEPEVKWITVPSILWIVGHFDFRSNYDTITDNKCAIKAPVVVDCAACASRIRQTFRRSMDPSTSIALR